MAHALLLLGAVQLALSTMQLEHERGLRTAAEANAQRESSDAARLRTECVALQARVRHFATHWARVLFSQWHHRRSFGYSQPSNHSCTSGFKASNSDKLAI